ncbi:DUF4080 domain-containing protein [Cetobacterium sp. SF1]|uniref:B12-binding domain-containing radical SAM protein n=1 Tax=unclassified Cetobacterium TaxID=2630983 RepID=UPI003CF3C0E6
MEKILLVGINSQYIHTNLAIRYLKSYVEKYSDKKIEIYESNINNQLLNIIRDIFEKNPTMIIFSTYIWNKEFVFKIISELRKILPDVKIVLGGPEVTYNPEEIIEENPVIDYLLIGEGERVILNFLTKDISEIKGVFYKDKNTKNIKYNGPENPIENLDEIPFPYSLEELKEQNKILYYESSRGCPFSCSYCLSSIDRGVRYFSLERVKEDLKIFLDNGIELIKFVDRTFNLRKDRYLGIWQFLLDNYKEGSTFHFEINANIFDEEVIEFLRKVPKGYFQFEIGVQSINEDTMASINRRNLLERLAYNVKEITKNIHLHLDLIAGLPYDTYERFKKSFDYVHNLKPEMVQLGFLKILKGTKISTELDMYNYKYVEFPPYEILENEFISYEELCRLKNVEKVLDYYYNSEKFKFTLEFILENFYSSPFDFYEEISEFYKKKNYIDIGHKEINIFNYLVEFYIEKNFSKYEIFIEYLKYDYLLIRKPGAYPEWFKSEKDKDKYLEILQVKNYNSNREGFKKTEIEKFTYNIFTKENEIINIFFEYGKQETKTTVY